MTPAAIIREAQSEGVKLALTPAGTIKVAGDGAAVSRWLIAIRERKAELIEALKGSAAVTATASRWWRIRYPGCDPVEIACFPSATRDEVLKMYRGAADVEPFTPDTQPPGGPLTAMEEGAVRRWLDLIEEDDPAVVAGVIERCKRDAEARAYFLGQARQAGL